MLYKNIFKIFLLFILCCVSIRSAYAISFSDYAYQKAADNKINDIRFYLNKGYQIDLPNTKGLSALCQSIQNNNYEAYVRLRQLGANPKHNCMRQVNQETAAAYAEQYSKRNFAYTSTNSDTNTKYAAAGLLAAGAVAGTIALANNDGSTHKTCPTGYYYANGQCNLIQCETGTHWVNGKCEPLNCPEGTVVEGNACRPVSECPTGEQWNGAECIAIICPENTHLQGNNCIVDDIVITNNNNNDVIAINSDEQTVYNLLSTPYYPNIAAKIEIENNGNGNVIGMQGTNDMYNAFVIKDIDGYANPLSNGTAVIKINDHGTGTVQGMYAQIDDITLYRQAINAVAEDGGTANALIDITHTGGGTTYGIMGDVRAYNAWALNGSNAYGNITIHGDGDIYGIKGYVAATNAVSPFFGNNKIIANINLYGEGNGDIYGMAISKDNIPGAGAGGGNLASWFAFNAYASGGENIEANINIRNPGNGNAYGMHGGQQLYNVMPSAPDENGNPTSTIRANINIANLGNGDAYGMYLPDEDANGIVANLSQDGATSVINITNVGLGTAYGMRGGKATRIVNSGEININNLGSGTAIGIYGEENSRIENSGSINITHTAYIDPETRTTYSPSKTLSGTAYGIYAEKGAFVNNSGKINITGAAAGQGIFLEEGATLQNNGIINFNGVDQSAMDATTTESAINLNDFGGEIILGRDGKFFADQLAGNLSVSENSVMDSFDNTYILNNSLQATDIENLNLKSKSAMFQVSTQDSSENGYDVVLQRQNFQELLQDKNIAEFLENNYTNENGLELFNELKKSDTNKSLNQATANLHGTDILPNFRRENALVYHHLSRQFNDTLFNHPEKNYIGGYKYIDISMDADGTLEGSEGTVNAAYAMLTGQADNGLTYGLGATIANLKSDYDNDSERKSNTFGIWVPVGKSFKNGAQWFSKAYLGYADGSYTRKTSLGKYTADTKEYQYGLSNEARYKMNLGHNFSFQPVAELNLLGIYHDAANEGNSLGALHIDSNNSLSLEGGLGAFLEKTFQFSENSKLGIQIGGIYYVEFLDPDDGTTAVMSGMDGKYKLRNKAQNDRAILSLKLNYNYKDITLYGMIEKETDASKAFTIDAGFQYKF